MGTVVAPGGVVVYGTGYAYPAWVGSVWYPVPITYGIGATVAYSTWGGWNVGFGIGYPVYPPYWGPYAYGAGFGAGMFTGLAVGAAIGASAWGWGWHGGYNVTVNNVYNHWGSGTVQARGNTYNYARVGNTTVARSGQQRLRRPRRERLPQRERPVAEERERQLEQRQPEPGAAAGEPGPVERLVPVPRPRFRGALGRRPELQPVPLQRRIRRPFLQRRRFREPLRRRAATGHSAVSAGFTAAVSAGSAAVSAVVAASAARERSSNHVTCASNRDARRYADRGGVPDAGPDAGERPGDRERGRGAARTVRPELSAGDDVDPVEQRPAAAPVGRRGTGGVHDRRRGLRAADHVHRRVRARLAELLRGGGALGGPGARGDGPSRRAARPGVLRAADLDCLRASARAARAAPPAGARPTTAAQARALPPVAAASA